MKPASVLLMMCVAFVAACSDDTGGNGSDAGVDGRVDGGDCLPEGADCTGNTQCCTSICNIEGKCSPTGWQATRRLKRGSMNLPATRA